MPWSEPKKPIRILDDDTKWRIRSILYSIRWDWLETIYAARGKSLLMSTHEGVFHLIRILAETSEKGCSLKKKRAIEWYNQQLLETFGDKIDLKEWTNLCLRNQ
jgi:hypothetical protein